MKIMNKNGPMYLIGIIMLIGGLGFIFRYGNFSDEQHHRFKVSGKIQHFSAGRGAAISIVDSNGKRLASCNVLDCGYSMDKSDDGKEAVFLLENKRIVEIEVEGALRVREEDMLTRNRRKIFQGALFSALGVSLIFFGYLKSRK